MSAVARHVAINLSFGAAAGIAFATAILVTNTAGLLDLIVTDGSAVAVILLYAFNVLTFSGIGAGIGIMTVPWGKPCDMRERKPPP
jgi:hypothetical protein